MLSQEKPKRGPSSDPIRDAICDVIGRQLDGILKAATGGLNGYGIDPKEAAMLRDALASIGEDLARTPFKLIRADVRDLIIRECQERGLAEHFKVARRDSQFYRFTRKFTPHPSWRGNAKLRREVEALYSPGETGKRDD